MDKNKSHAFRLWKIIILAIVLLVGIAVLSLFIANNSFFGSIAVIPISGEISLEVNPLSKDYSAIEIVEKLDEAENNPMVSAIFLEINSPGGSIVASRQIVKKILEVKKTKPVVAWIGEIGTSGAYYVAASCDRVYADADSITGSIGVISIIPNVEGLFKKLGIKFNTVEIGKYKSMVAFYKDLNSDERKIIETILKKSFKRFKDEILALRHSKLRREELEKIADGRILSGEQALESGLIDGILTREGAIAKTAELAGIVGKPSVVEYKKEVPSLLNLIGAFSNMQSITNFLAEPKLRS